MCIWEKIYRALIEIIPNAENLVKGTGERHGGSPDPYKSFSVRFANAEAYYAEHVLKPVTLLFTFTRGQKKKHFVWQPIQIIYRIQVLIIN